MGTVLYRRMSSQNCLFDRIGGAAGKQRLLNEATGHLPLRMPTQAVRYEPQVPISVPTDRILVHAEATTPICLARKPDHVQNCDWTFAATSMKCAPSNAWLLFAAP